MTPVNPGSSEEGGTPELDAIAFRLGQIGVELDSMLRVYAPARRPYLQGCHGVDLVSRAVSSLNAIAKELRSARLSPPAGAPTPNELDEIATRLWEALDGDQGPLALDLAILLGAARDHECAACESRRLFASAHPAGATDTARLDWLERVGAYVTRYDVEFEGMNPHWETHNLGANGDYFGASAREAIDEAMTAAASTPEEPKHG